MTEKTNQHNEWRTNGPLNEWLTSGERGISSDTIVMHLTGRTHVRYPSVPYDPSDFRRCERLLRQVPLLRLHFPFMADVSAAWAALVERWDEIVAVYEREVPGCFDSPSPCPIGSAPKAHALIRECRDVSAAATSGGE